MQKRHLLARNEGRLSEEQREHADWLWENPVGRCGLSIELAIEELKAGLPVEELVSGPPVTNTVAVATVTPDSAKTTTAASAAAYPTLPPLDLV